MFKVLGSLGYQCLYQKILSASSSSTAKFTSVVSAFMIMVIGLPLILIGAGAASTGNTVPVRPLAKKRANVHLTSRPTVSLMELLSIKSSKA